MTEYRVDLEVYNGPLDLLLYLIRREEVDVCDIPIARITEQYIAYVEMLRTLDPNLAGDFLVMAATLMEVKTRMLLPTPPPEEGGADGLEIDPRAELVRQLLQYKAFRDAADDLRQARELQSMKFPRRPPKPPRPDESALDIDYAQIWDLFDAFSKLMESIGLRNQRHEVIYDDTPVELHAADIIDRLAREGALLFSLIFEGRTTRSELVGLFLALLELIRRRRIIARQDDNFGEIAVELNPNPPSEEELADEQIAFESTRREVARIADDEQVSAENTLPAPPAMESDDDTE
jgi:segregation and condensation protein A